MLVLSSARSSPIIRTTTFPCLYDALDFGGIHDLFVKLLASGGGLVDVRNPVSHLPPTRAEFD
jgi:hypothetical protein